MAAGDRPDAPPRVCAICGRSIRSWLTTTDQMGKVFCLDHFTYGGIWADSLKEGATEADESVQGPDTASEGANGSMDAPSDEDELRQMAEAFRSDAPIMREGPTGCGKTMTVTEFAYATGLPLWKVNPLDGGEA